MLQICSNWAESNFMSFNPKKSEILVFSKYKFSDKMRNSFEHRFKIGGGNVEVKAEVKYLGIFLSGSHAKTYNNFLTKSLNKAKKRLSEIRSFGFHKDGLKVASAVRFK